MGGAAVPLGGATQRLLPERIPLRFFGSAVVVHVFAWLALALAAQGAPGFVGGVGPELAAVHVLTIGVLVMTAMGASFQMLPVALGRSAPPVQACNIVFATVLAGGSCLITGMTMRQTEVVVVGALLLAVGVMTYAVSIAALLAGATAPSPLIHHVWAGVGALVGAVGLALTLAINYGYGFLAEPQSWALAHAVLAGFGFMGMYALGFSTILIPLFSMAEAPAGAAIQGAFWLVLLAIMLALGGIVAANQWVVAAAAAVGFGGASLHVQAMRRALAARMRRRLSPEFLLIRVSWLLLLASLLLGLALAVGVVPERVSVLFGFTLLFGWLLTLLVAVLQRIVPFLASMHLLRAGKRGVSPSKLVSERPLTVHRWCHLIAIALIAAGLVWSWPPLIQVGAVIGSVGAAAFAWAVGTVLVRARDHLATAIGVEERRTP